MYCMYSSVNMFIIDFVRSGIGEPPCLRFELSRELRVIYKKKELQWVMCLRR
jgi:hypothetical protein